MPKKQYILKLTEEEHKPVTAMIEKGQIWLRGKDLLFWWLPDTCF